MAKVWMPVEDGEITTFLVVDDNGKTLGVFAGDDYTDWYATADLPDEIRLCRQVEAAPLTQQQQPNADGLLPCQKCGGASSYMWRGANGGEHKYECRKCDTETAWNHTQAEAEKEWNRRAPQQPAMPQDLRLELSYLLQASGVAGKKPSRELREWVKTLQARTTDME